jgi:hypothetical protein
MTETKTSQRTVELPALADTADAERLEQELGKLEGVVLVSVDAGNRRVRIEWTEATLDWPAIRWFLEQVGYPPGGEPGETEMLA